jgi:2-polyprenyl-3-methyl-5-hydroxy-6-metoxy-1,4-benzoquinol methylase
MSAEQRSRPCPVCGSPRADPSFEKGDLHVVKCRVCSMLYANPVPVEFVSGQYYDDRGTDYYLSPAKLESDYAPVRFERELRLFRRFCLGGAVLDVGCSTGGFLYNLNERFPGGYRRLGTDVSGPALDYAASRGVPVSRGNFLDSPCGPFDAVTFWAVLEHVFEPRLFLERAWSLLKPDGLCFALVPNMKSLATRLLGARYRYIYPQHLNYFTSRTLTRFVKDQFSVLELRSMHFNPLVIWQDWRSSGVEVSNRERAQLLQRTTAYKRKGALAPVRLAYRFVESGLGVLKLADNLAIVLRKKSR